MAEDSFKLPASSYEEIRKFIVAYKNFGKEAGLDDISKITGAHTTVISKNTKFLSALGIITEGQKKAATNIGTKLGQAFEFDMEPDIRSTWLEIVEGNDFLRNLVSSVRVRRGMDADALRAHVAYSAGQPKNSSVMTGAGTVIDILRTSGAIEEQDGKFVAADVKTKASADQTAVNEVHGERHSPRTGTSHMPITAGMPTAATPAGVQVSIRINVDCAANELEQVGQQLQQLLRNLKQADPEAADEHDLSAVTEDELDLDSE